jgi:Ca2+-transporting ATPase
LPSRERRSFVRIAAEIAFQPMFALLLAAALVYLLLGETSDALVLGLFATFSVSIGILQESRSERVLDALRELASPRAMVIRDGERRRIPGREVVPGDILVLAEGDRVAADGDLISADALMLDESLLTGESVPVRKAAAFPADTPRTAGGEDRPFVFAGTLVTRGAGIARVNATGSSSQMGQIGQSLKSIQLEQPRLRLQLRWLIRNFALSGIAVAAAVALLSGLLRGSWLDALLGGIAIGMSVLPEEIPLVLTVFMAMGAWRISRLGILTRRAAAIETLGAATILCTDKTGTLTENRMRLEMAATDGTCWRHGQLPDPATEKLLHAAMAASAPLPTDPMDRAIHEAALAAELHPPQELLRSYGFSAELPAVTNVWAGSKAPTASAFAKGAPETIFSLCRLPSETRAALLRDADQFAGQGLRLLAVAAAELSWEDGAQPQAQHDIPFHYLGLVGFADPLRQSVAGAVAQCRSAGVRVIMITGDYPVTAQAIAHQAGIDAGNVLAGDTIAAMDDVALATAVRGTSVFARIRPQQKLRLVEALKRQGEIVAMTGDGVNDAPALKAAHIGIAMGSRGTDVARETSSLVLLNDDFSSLVATIRMGRRIYDNLRKAIEYIVAVHIPIAGLALLPLLLGLPMMLLPIHIAMLEMVIDPACSIIFEAEPEERDVMQRPPRRPDTPVLPSRSAIWAGLQGLASLLLVAASLGAGLALGLAEADLRAMVFTVLVLMNIGLILVNRSFHASLREALARPNASLWYLVTAVLVMVATALYWPPAQALFRFGPLHWGALAYCVASGILLISLLEFAKARLGTDGPKNGARI